jgi:retron-type reverse transcriptase
MTLSTDSLEWAVQFVADHSDGDLFPRVAEIAAIAARKREFAQAIANRPLGDFKPGAHRRFIVPKDDISYRQATQLDPQDSIILSAIAYQFGQGIELKRRPANQVFSYRFSPSVQHGLYNREHSWNAFWTTAADEISPNGYALYCDISDFYNQIYHHVVENQLIAAGFPNQAMKWVIDLLGSTTAGVSRGVPIGPHAIHLVAEATLIPIDNSMVSSGLKFLRYADDIVVFAASEHGAKRALQRLAQIMDKQQRLTLQRHKTRIFAEIEFKNYCNQMIENRPISDEEDQILQLVEKYSDGNPYQAISYDEIATEDWASISSAVVRSIIEEYVNASEINFIRLRWFYRRLAQIGHPGAIEVTLENIDILTPCFASICAYLASIQSIPPEQWKDIGEQLLALLSTDEVQDSEYFRLSILSLFSRNADINHFANLAALYPNSDSFTKREILLAARANGAADWLREFKEDFEGMERWQKSAFLYCCRAFPADERRHFIGRWKFERPFDAELAAWAKAGS